MDYTFVSAAALFIYDYTLTWHLEIKLIWFSPWTYTKVLYLLIRYIAFADVLLFVINQIFHVSPELCSITYPVATWFVILQIFLSEAVLSIRTWAVWRGKKGIGLVLSALTLAHLVAQCIFTNKFVRSMEFTSPPILIFRGCFMEKSSTALWINYVLMTIIEAVVLTLMVISAFRAYRLGIIGKLSHVIHRDGILFYIYLLCLTIGNLVATIVLPIDLMAFLTPLHSVLYAVLTTRIVLNIRAVSNQSMQTELHTSYEMPLEFDGPLVQLLQHQDSGFE